ncbi:MAG TPA: hypothetical protein VF530_03730 [Planctomycetota bacterium]
MRNLLAFVLSVLLGCAGVVLFREYRNRLSAPSAEAPAAVAEDAERAAEAPDRRAPGLAPRREPVEPPEELAQPAAPSVLTGTVVVLDEQGVQHAGEDGFLALQLGLAGARTRHEIEVRDGRWSLPLAPSHAGGRRASVVLRASVLGERIATPAPGQAAELALPSDGRVDLRMHWPAAPRLHVRARDTGRELEEVFLYELPTAQRGSPLDGQHPGPDAQGRAAGPSPVALEAGASASLGDERVVFARSPGYAWGRIELDPGLAEVPTLTLDPAGALELAVVGEPQLTALEILLLAAEPPRAEVLVLQRDKTRTFRLEDLRAGRYTAEARSYGLLAGTLEVEVRAGERVQAVLEVAPQAAPLVPFEGVLILPEEYGTDAFMLEFLLQGRFETGSLTRGSFEIRSTEMTLEAGAPRRFRWSVPAAQPARYRIVLVPHFATELESGPSGTRDARIEVPPPCRVSLRCLDEQTGTEVASEKVSWAALTPRAFTVWGRASNAGSNAASLEFWVPQGPLLIFTTPELYEPCARVVEVGPGTNELLLRLRKKP